MKGALLRGFKIQSLKQSIRSFPLSAQILNLLRSKLMALYNMPSFLPIEIIALNLHECLCLYNNAWSTQVKFIEGPEINIWSPCAHI